jgi:beta-lactamase regulating signal transducer with metallopeptidase domain
LLSVNSVTLLGISAQGFQLQLLTFWLIATAMVCLTSAVLVVPLYWSRRSADDPRRRLWPAVAVCALLPLAALAIYAAVGAPHLAATTPAAVTEQLAAAHANGALEGQTTGGDLAAAVQRLKDKLARNPQDADGWPANS